MAAIVPSWTQLARREKEAELIFRGEQYARAIGLYQRRAGPGVLPPNLDVLVEQKLLRKKYKDPITGDDFAVLSPMSQAPGTAGQNQRPGRGAQPGAGTSPAASSPAGRAAGGVMGVTSKSSAESLREYKGRTHYNEWQFVYVAQAQAPGGSDTPEGPGRGPQPPGRGPGAPPFGGDRTNVPRPPMRGGPGGGAAPQR